MNGSRILIEQAFNGIRLERIPIFDLFCNDEVIEYFAGVKLGGADDEMVVTMAAGSALDGTRSISVPSHDRSTWIDRAGNTRISDRWTSWLKKSAYQDVEDWAGWLEEYIEKYQASSGMSIVQLDLTEAKPTEERRKSVVTKQRMYNDLLNGTVNIYCTPSTAINALLYYMGLEIVSYLWACYRELLLRWIDLYRQATINYIEIAANHQISPVAMIYSDIAYNNGLMFSNSMLNDLGFFEEVEQICHTCHKKGLKVIFHSDGYFMSLLDDLIVTGIDGLNPIEKAAGMDIYEIRSKYPDLTLVGGVDVTHLLRLAKPEEIRIETRKIINETGTEGHLLLGSSTEVGSDIPLENYLAFHSEVLK